MSEIQPTIIWKQYKLGNDGGLVVSDLGSGNTVDYQAVQAGQYSPAICVRPQFQSDSTTSSIGSVRLWWSTFSANNPSGNSVSLPANNWVLKYYVTDCNTALETGGSQGTSDTKLTRCAKMLRCLRSADKLSKVTTGVKINGSVLSGQSDMMWCQSVWTTEKISMQPVPFSGYKDNHYQHYDQYQTNYGGNSSWYTTVFGISALAPYSRTDLMSYAAGGSLSGTEYKCNLKASVSTNDDFPFIFFTIKAPTTADAGSWSGWACRISYIWPYTSSTIQTV